MTEAGITARREHCNMGPRFRAGTWRRPYETEKGVEKMNKHTQKKTRVAAVALGAACVASILLGGRAVWMNMGGLLTAVFGLFTLMGYGMSPTSDPANIRTYVPLNIFDPSFDGAHTVLATQSAAPEINDEFLYGIGPEYRRYVESVKAVCWNSLAVWVLLITLIVLSVMLLKRRKDALAHIPVLWAWTFVALVPALYRLMLWAVGTMDSAITFYLMAGCAFAALAMGWNVKQTPEGEDASRPAAPTQERETPEGS